VPISKVCGKLEKLPRIMRSNISIVKNFTVLIKFSIGYNAAQSLLFNPNALRRKH